MFKTFIFRATTERRKRSTMSQHSPSSNLHRSLRRQMTLSLRFFYSINSYRSNANSIDESCSTVQNAPFAHNASEKGVDSPNDSLTPSITGLNNNHKISAVSNNVNYTGNGEGLFGMRNGRAHTYCSPKPLHFGGKN